MISFVVNQSLALLHQSLKQNSYASKKYIFDKMVRLWWIHDYFFTNSHFTFICKGNLAS